MQLVHLNTVMESKANDNTVPTTSSCFDKIPQTALHSHRQLTHTPHVFPFNRRFAKFQLYGTCCLHPPGMSLPQFCFIISQPFQEGVNAVMILLQETFSNTELFKKYEDYKSFLGLMKLVCRYFVHVLAVFLSLLINCG